PLAPPSLMPAPLLSWPGGGGGGRSLDPHLQAHVEHHRGQDVDVGEVHAQPPGQVEEGEQCAREPLAEGAVGAASRRGLGPTHGTRPAGQLRLPPDILEET
uniref:Uncharacterized protein n=1 Tax=Sus scrofa TaxID=9823 RepID=A0A8D0NAG8_PIG